MPYVYYVMDISVKFYLSAESSVTSYMKIGYGEITVCILLHSVGQYVYFTMMTL